ncbi:MAG: bifunctional ADP-heptose synthase [bacterium]|nr:bifunctional ADP-heptose synthase [bacterium]
MTNYHSAILEKISTSHIMVIGDVILDEYLIGNSTRLSREAPVPVLEFTSRKLIAGGAGNPSANLSALGAHVYQIGVVGGDEFASPLRQILQDEKIDISGIITDPTRPTTVKTRIMAQMGLRFPQQVARLDRLSRKPVSDDIETTLMGVIADKLPQMNAILCSDYHGGLLTPSLVEKIRMSGGDKLLTADAQGELDKYRGFDVVKCNADEAQSALGGVLSTHDDFAHAAKTLQNRLNLRGGMVITRGGDGMTIAQATGEVHHIPAPAVTDVYDTVGAGDTAIALLTGALCVGGTYLQAGKLANIASGLVVRRVGNYAPSAQEIITEFVHYEE